MRPVSLRGAMFAQIVSRQMDEQTDKPLEYLT